MKIFKFISVFCVSFVIAEILLRFFVLFSTSISNYSKSNYLYTPNSVMVNNAEGYAARKVNQLGFFDREYIPVPKDSIIRIILLGNSFSEASQVDLDSNYENRLEDLLHSQLKKRVEIWNLAHAGASLLDSYDSFFEIVKKIPYRYVLIQIPPYSIRESHTTNINSKIINDTVVSDLQKIEKNTKINTIQQLLIDHSVVINLLSVRLYIFKRYLLNIINHKTNLLNINDLVMLNNNLDVVIKDVDIKYYDSLISFFSKKIAKQNSNLIIFTVPFEKNVKITNLYKSICNRNNAIYIDLSKFSELSDTTGYPMLGFLNTKLGYGHLNEHGHYLLANALDSVLLPIFSVPQNVETFSKNQPQ